MKNKYIQYAPIIFAAFGMSFAIAGYFINFYLPSNIATLVWLILMITFLILGLKFGKLIRSLYIDFHKDSLTGLKNRMFFYFKLDYIMERISNAPEPLTLIMIDIDNFKYINDTFGHVNGDKVLKNMAEIFKANVRKYDILARWGGEEFTILLPGTDVSKATLIAERIRESIEKHEFKINNTSLNITVSMGVYTTTKKMAVNDFVEHADQALYKAKERKNQVVSYEQILSA